MNKYQFLGELYPRGVLVLKDFNLKSYDTKTPNYPFAGDMDLKIDSDTVIVTFETNQNFDKDLETLKNSLEYYCANAINSANYYFGTSVHLRLTHGGNMTGEFYSFPPVNNDLKNKTTERPLLPIDLTLLANGNMPLRRALEQATEAISHPIDTGLCCYRSLEAIRKNFIPSGAPDEGATKRESWEKINKTLKITTAYYKLIKEHADETRHGGIINVSSAEMTEMITKTWTIIDRYIVYLSKGIEELSAVSVLE